MNAHDTIQETVRIRKFNEYLKNRKPNEMKDTYSQELIQFTMNADNRINIKRKALTITNAMHFNIAEGFFNRLFIGFKLIVRHIINNQGRDSK